MGKSILIGSMLVLAMLLLMPSIPAIQQNTIEEGIKQDIQERLDEITLDDLKDIEELEWIRHPILYIIVLFLLNSRVKRGLFLVDISSTPYKWWYDIDYLNIFWRGAWLLFTAYCWQIFWSYVSILLRWHWELPEFPYP